MNVIDITKFGQTVNHYVYVDGLTHFADKILDESNIKTKFVEVAEDEDSDFVLVHCTVAKRNEAKFEEAMNKLDEKMQDVYGSSYTLFCRRWDNRLKELESSSDGDTDE